MTLNLYFRCGSYGTLPSGCSLVPDPKDIDCCKVVSCVPKVGPNGTLVIPPGGPTGGPPGGPTGSPGASVTPPTPFVVTNPPVVHYGSFPTIKPDGETGLVKSKFFLQMLTLYSLFINIIDYTA